MTDLPSGEPEAKPELGTQALLHFHRRPPGTKKGQVWVTVWG